MVRAARVLVHPPAADALGEHLVGHLERQHERHLVARLLEHGVEHLRLLDRAREAVEDEAARAVLVRDPILDDRDDQLVAHKPTRRHHVLGLLAHLAAGSHRGAQHVAGRELRDAEGLDDLGRLRALAGARRAEEDHNGLGARVRRRERRHRAGASRLAGAYRPQHRRAVLHEAASAGGGAARDCSPVSLRRGAQRREERASDGAEAEHRERAAHDEGARGGTGIHADLGSTM
eukprot:scaffold13874_cov63-Phaeocystis_antarctica.AAC.2